MKNMLIETDTDVSWEIEKWLRLHKDEFDENHRISKHLCLMFDDESNMYEVQITVRRVYDNDIAAEDR